MAEERRRKKRGHRRGRGRGQPSTESAKERPEEGQPEAVEEGEAPGVLPSRLRFRFGRRGDEGKQPHDRTQRGRKKRRTPATPAVSPPYWVRVERKGNALNGYLSPDGIDWTQQGQTVTVDMWGAAVFIGLCVTSHASGELRTYEFDNVWTTGAVLGQWEAEDVGIDQPSNDPAPLYIAAEDITGNVGVVFHPEPDAVVTNNWDRWMIPLSAFAAAGVDLRVVEKMSIGIGVPTSLPPLQSLKLFASPASGGEGRIWIDDISVKLLKQPPPEFQVLKGTVRNRLMGKPITYADNAKVAWRWPGDSVDIGGDYTNSEGFYKMLLPDGEVEIVVTADGFCESRPDLQRESTNTSIKRDFLLMPDPDPSLSCPIYRFRSPNAPYSYYFAADESVEMETLLYDGEPFDPDNWRYNGIAFCAEVAGKPNALPVYRFLHKENKIPAYTITLDEFKDHPSWTTDDKFGAVAFYAYPPYSGDQETHPEGTYPPNEEPDGTRPVYQFWSESLKCHFYTINPSERDEKLADQAWEEKPVAWYAFGYLAETLDLSLLRIPSLFINKGLRTIASSRKTTRNDTIIRKSWSR